MTDAVLILRGLEELYPETRFIERLRHCVETYPDLNWEDAMSRGQITSKLWIIHQLQMLDLEHLGRVAICGGWVGILARLLLDSDDIFAHYIESMDRDLLATIAAGELSFEYINDDVFLARAVDCNLVRYADFDTIINTSCEHFSDFERWWQQVPKGKLVILQSNDFMELEDHVDCVLCEEELAAKAEMSEVYFQGSLRCIKYTRYMVIGRK
jgi:hypothetical protein